MDSSLMLCLFTIAAGTVHQYFMVPKELSRDRWINLAITMIWVVAGGLVGWAVPLAFRVTNDITLPCVVALTTFMAGVICGRVLVWLAQEVDKSTARRAYRESKGGKNG